MIYEVTMKNETETRIKLFKEANDALKCVNSIGLSLEEDDIGDTSEVITVSYNEMGFPAIELAVYECEEELKPATVCKKSGTVITINRIAGSYDDIDEVYGVRRFESELSYGFDNEYEEYMEAA